MSGRMLDQPDGLPTSEIPQLGTDGETAGTSTGQISRLAPGAQIAQLTPGGESPQLPAPVRSADPTSQFGKFPSCGPAGGEAAGALPAAWFNG